MSRPTTAALVRELEAHMGLLLLDPTPLAKAPEHFLTYWRGLLEQLQALLAATRGR
jgi:hypothetical protein